MGGKGVPNIAGIKKLSDTSVEVTVEGFDATAIYSLGVSVSPSTITASEQYDYATTSSALTSATVDGRAHDTMRWGPVATSSQVREQVRLFCSE
jgi:hypothetical protein